MSEKITLDNVTLFAAYGNKFEETQKAINKSCKHIDFAKIVNIYDPRINSILKYSQFILEEMPYAIDTEFVLIIQWDGFVINHKAWDTNFLKYDYIGAPWPPWGNLCGNGGFSLRSKKFLKLQKEIVNRMDYEALRRMPLIKDTLAEDFILTYIYREFFESNGCVISPYEVGSKFSVEVEEYDKNNLPFGFHGQHHPELIDYN